MRLLLVVLFALLLASCGRNDGVIENGPRLISEVTLPPVTFAPTRALSPTPSPVNTKETEVPRVITLTQTDFELVTPTLPPSKTPTVTPTITPTRPSPTPAPTLNLQAQEPVLVPTMLHVDPSTAVALAPNPAAASSHGEVSIPLPGVPDVPAAQCTSAQWFFREPRLPDCPLNPAVESPAAYEAFEYGFMIWVGAQDAIYVFYDSVEVPRWQVFQDTWEDGMPERDPGLDSQAPPYSNFQPKRGFGLIWRNTPGMIQRIGWAESDYENAYVTKVQTRSDGTIYLMEPNGRAFALYPNGADWHLYGD